MNKIKVRICSGTTCFVMGSSFLNDLYDIIPEKYNGQVIVEPSLCLGQCSKSGKHSKAPYVLVDDEIVAEATIESVISAIDKKVSSNE
ncbi:MAG: NAD(P)H-dependent oxidoreductase subunit E [Candidatus Gastranaerophilales bacterium]|nr:NAD(P)H-dependent oxidoreductase subunit E [Candidatus Gastranaerophilales bacterium]